MSKGGKATYSSLKRQNAAKVALKRSKKRAGNKANNENLRDLLDKQSSIIQEASMNLNETQTVTPDFSALHAAQTQQNQLDDLEAILRGF
ncbi:hypothetical protein BKA70DRAFT_668473 [Coprinopsis sp. MPI-PUGE-AT-0042]|nr:hypothetical protein BKA70DRAFT_668473 [Coprinopsis sp. MPI-PUGE-AT-0042]